MSFADEMRTGLSLERFSFMDFCFFFSDCDVMHMSLSSGNLSQSNIEGQGKPWDSMVPRQPVFTF